MKTELTTTNPEQSPERCETCKFWLKGTVGNYGYHSETNDMECQIGKCRRMPPVFISAAAHTISELRGKEEAEKTGHERIHSGDFSSYVWDESEDYTSWLSPTTLSSDWCGEWKTKG